MSEVHFFSCRNVFSLCHDIRGREYGSGLFVHQTGPSSPVDQCIKTNVYLTTTFSLILCLNMQVIHYLDYIHFPKQKT